MKIYTERQVVMISERQAASLHILKQYGVNVSQFIRAAIATKIKQEWPEIKARKEGRVLPF